VQTRIAVELQLSTDEKAKGKINRAFTLYKTVANLNSGGKIDPNGAAISTRERAHKAAVFAMEYAAADDTHRIVLDAKDEENQKAEVQLQAERKRSREEVEKSKAELLAKADGDRSVAEKSM
jgi:hypothetical protein